MMTTHILNQVKAWNTWKTIQTLERKWSNFSKWEGMIMRLTQRWFLKAQN